MTSVIDADLAFGGDTNPEGIVFRGQDDLVSGRHRERDEEVSPAPVIEGGLTEILGDLLGYRMNLGIMHGVLGQDPGLAVHQVVLAEI